MSTKITRLQ